MKSVLTAIRRAGHTMKFAGLFLYLVCGHLLPKTTRQATGWARGRSKDTLRVQADAEREPRRPGHFPAIAGGMVALALMASVTSCLAGALLSQSVTPKPQAFVKVNYADTLLGVQAMFAVRACSAEDSTVHRQVGQVAEPPAGLAFIREEMSAEPQDIVVRVFDVDGREISRHDGPRDVCGYARLAAAFVASADARSAEAAR